MNTVHNRFNQFIRRAALYCTLLLPAGFLSCEDVIDVELPVANPIVVIDAFINNQPEDQTIRITRTQPYFDNSAPEGIAGAEVTVVDDQGNVRIFNEKNEPGLYVWESTPAQPVFGSVGNSFDLAVNIDGAVYTASSRMNRVPVVDSITFRFEKGNSFFPDSYFGQLYAKDFEGPGDTYWIKTWKNGTALSRPNEILVAYDAGFSAGGNIDGIIFIQPIRDGINPFEQDEDDNFLSPYSPGDSVYVEIHSITNETFNFFNQLVIQTDRPGGFGELFATPLANVPSNITWNPESSTGQAVGFFNVAAVRSGSGWLDPDNLPTEED
jgi:hypothetical protein